jgi:malate dehydrogenase (oxaloacetate-decarboxylating)
MKITQILLLEVVHAPGNLSKVLAVVGDAGVPVQALQSLDRKQNRTRWELTVEMESGEVEAMCAEIDKLPIAKVIGSSDRVMRRHEGGKIEVKSRSSIDDLQVLRDIYTPGVAHVCLAIEKDPSLARKYTSLAHTVAIVTNGTAILGLGDIGAVAGLPVMEGKAALFQIFAGVSGIPILLETKDAGEIIKAVEAIAPSFGAIQLEDIAAPECFEVEDALRAKLKIPVLHDDQHGTAVVVIAALINAARITGVNLEECVIGQIGLGAAGLGISQLLMRFGVHQILGADLSKDAQARLKDIGGIPAELDFLMEHADVVISTTGVKGLIKPEMVREGQIIFALSNPDPEIEPAIALEQGARFAADGRNVNNVLAFPGLFRGALDAGVNKFTDSMLLAAAHAIADAAPEGELIPSPLSHHAHDMVAKAVEEAAMARI